jgi:Mn2+/Fe2+ NRAMP family transporter
MRGPSLKSILGKLGPGFLFAATAIGTSHLVQTTRGSADYGMFFFLPVAIICLIKYPAIQAGVEYAVRSGRNILDGYASVGRWLLILLLIAFLTEGIPAITGVSLVTAGILKNNLNLTTPDAIVTLIVIAICALTLYLGKYRVLERVSKTFVVLFSVLVVVAAIASVSILVDTSGPLAATIPISRDGLFFIVAMAGWMPAGMAISPMLSTWVCARAAREGNEIVRKEAQFDLTVGYAGSVFLAFCFVIIGTSVLFVTGATVSSSSVGFARQLTGLFVESFGPAMGPVVSIAALLVMLSSVFGVMDGFTRLSAGTLQRIIAPADDRAADRYYPRLLLVEVLAAASLVLFLMQSFLTFIDIAITTAFITAPVIAIANHHIIFGNHAAENTRPSPLFRYWSIFGAAILLLVALAFLFYRFFI